MNDKEARKILKHMRSLSREELEVEFLGFIQAHISLVEENGNLKKDIAYSNGRYLAGCKSSGGITLPPNFS